MSDAAVEMLRQTRPWTMVFSLLCFIGSAFMLLASAALVIMGSTLAKGSSPISSAVGLVYIPFAGLYVYPGIKLWAYSSSIARLVATRSPSDLESALAQQKAFWKYSGIAALAVIVLYFVGILAVVAVSAFAATVKD